METILIAVVVILYEVDIAILRNKTKTSRGDPLGLWDSWWLHLIFS